MGGERIVDRVSYEVSHQGTVVFPIHDFLVVLDARVDEAAAAPRHATQVAVRAAVKHPRGLRTSQRSEGGFYEWQCNLRKRRFRLPAPAPPQRLGRRTLQAELGQGLPWQERPGPGPPRPGPGPPRAGQGPFIDRVG